MDWAPASARSATAAVPDRSNLKKPAGLTAEMKQEGPLRRAERLADRVLSSERAKRRMLVIVNPYATTVSHRLKGLVVYALQGRYSVEAVDTQARNHATNLCREAAAEGYDIVVAFGGDGTVNEAANGLVGSDTPLAVLPGGSANVFCRTVGMPTDVVDATEHLLGLADDFRSFSVDTGTVNGRHFLFASGVGLDASVVREVDGHPTLKARLRHYYYAYAAITTFARQYIAHPPALELEVAGKSVTGVTVVCQNSDPFSYFGRRAIRLCENAGLDTGDLAMLVLKRARPLELGTLAARILSQRPRLLERHRQIEAFSGVQGARVTGLDREVPVQVDGDYIGCFPTVNYGVAPRSLSVVA